MEETHPKVICLRSAVDDPWLEHGYFCQWNPGVPVESFRWLVIHWRLQLGLWKFSSQRQGLAAVRVADTSTGDSSADRDRMVT